MSYFAITALLGALAAPAETPVVLASEPAPLHGALLTPDGPVAAAAVILPGSGPTDRDGNSPLGVNAGTYRLLAQGLADRGVATIRIDKRGIGESRAAGGNESDLRFDAYAADARAWAAEAARRTGQSCAWLIGHSEGALVAQVAASEGDAPICGLVLISGAGRPAGAVLREQLSTALPEPLKAPAMAAIDALEAGRTTEAPPELAAVFRPSVQPYLISWLSLDPARLAAAYPGPTLVIQGTTDLQISMDDARGLADARPGVRLVVVEGANHVLKTAPTERAANLATYADPAAPLAPGVAEAVADFILSGGRTP